MLLITCREESSADYSNRLVGGEGKLSRLYSFAKCPALSTLKSGKLALGKTLRGDTQRSRCAFAGLAVRERR